MKFYVASSLGNIAQAKQAISFIQSMGHEVTYDWTIHGSMQAKPSGWSNVAVSELEGVKNADVVIAIMPGGRGTHVELGVGMGLGKRCFVVGTDPDEKYACVFHHHPEVTRVNTVADALTRYDPELMR